MCKRKWLLWVAMFVVFGGVISLAVVIANNKQASNQKLDSNTLAIVNGDKITKKFFDDRYQSLSEDYKSSFKNNQEGFLDQLIIREVLYQEAVKKDFNKKSTGVTDLEERKDFAIRELIKNVTLKIVVSETEMKDFYNTHQAEVQGASYEATKLSIQNYLTQQKQNAVVDQLIIDLKQKAVIIKNEKWLATWLAAKPQNPLAKILKNGKPTVLDIGSGTCIPCKMMKPIFAELGKEYQGKANITLLEINDYRDVANQYQVRVIPTQIFFDKSGNQVWRHEGFLAKTEIIKKLKELGAN